MLFGATLFSGIGAPEVAMPHWDWRWHAEIDQFPSAVMAARHPQSINLGDVSADDFAERAEKAGRPNVLIFGSPCQSYSVAGKRLGLDDPRGNLALVALGIVDRLKPDWFVFENVPGLFSSFSGSEHAEREVREGPVGGSRDGQEDRDFATFLSRVRGVGYFGCWSVLDAQYFGMAQRRQRAFFVGHSRDWRASAAILLEPEGLRGYLAPRRTAGEGNSGRIAHSLRGEGFDASEDGTGRGTPLAVDYTNGSVSDVVGTLEAAQSKGNRSQGVIAFDTTQLTSKENRSQPRAGASCHPLAATAHIPSVAIQEAQTGVREYETAGSLRANGPGHDPVGTRVLAGSAVRKLTPRECERLQGFPDDFTLITYRGKPAADGPRYKALGNSMAVPVMRHILTKIEMYETLVKPRIAA